WYMELKAMRRKYTDAVDYINADRNDPLRLYLVIFTDALLVLKLSREEQMEIIHRAFNWLFDLIDQKKCLDEKDVVQQFSFEMKEVKLTSIDVFSCYRAYMETQGRYLRLANEEFRPGNGEMDTLLNKYGNNKNDKDKDEKASDDSISGNAGQMEGVNACVKDE
ncbi:MAG: hypothetical protein IKR90_03350, partial [Clostridia bacterium]|nr:hypothetical protein [Clostridia bacterium]